MKSDLAQLVDRLISLCDEAYQVVNSFERKHMEVLKPTVETIQRINLTLLYVREIQAPFRFRFRTSDTELALSSMAATHIKTLSSLIDEMHKLKESL